MQSLGTQYCLINMDAYAVKEEIGLANLITVFTHATVSIMLNAPFKL
jgi:hypothetical protein